jgi:peptidoglycan/xylan/chitin deacetylase (PgdA/CDA1 family)
MLKCAIKRLVLPLAARLGLPRRIGARLAPGRLALLMYHGVTAQPLAVPDWCFLPVAEFRAQMTYLASYCRVLPLDAALAELRGEVPRDRDPRPRVAITFDDGYMNNATVALPVLREFGLPAMIFLNTGFLNTRDWLWASRLHAALAETRLATLAWRGATYPLATAAERAESSAQLQAALKAQPHAQLLRDVAELIAALGGDPQAPVVPGSPYEFMDDAALRACLDSGLIDFGAHTHTHTILAHLPHETQRAEIEQSVRGVSEILKRPCTWFAYPNGRAEDYTPETITILRELGIQGAVTTRELANGPATDGLQLGRYGIGCGTPLWQYQAQVHHVLTRGRTA